MGPASLKGYTIEADVRGTEARRQRGGAGLINQRYALVLFGNGQKLELHPWQAADEMTVRVPYKWDANKWYRIKLRVDNRPDGTVQARGKVWPTGEPEPDAWTIEKVDKIGHREGSPGLYGDGISELYFDNLTVYQNNKASKDTKVTKDAKGSYETAGFPDRSVCAHHDGGALRRLADVG